MTRILVVDDSRTQAQMVAMVLQSGSFEPDVAESGEAAIEKLRDNRYDLIISDVVMPGISGYEFCRQIKNDAAHKDTPVILLTSLKDPMDIVHGLECGADNFLTKPCEPNHLLSRVQTILENRRQRGTTKRRLDVGVEITFLGNSFTISSDREQILDLLIATFEDIVLKNNELQESQRKLAEANKRAEEYAQQLEAHLRSVEQRYDKILEYAAEGIIVIDEDGIIETINPAANRIFGYDAEDVVGANVTILMPEPHRSDHHSYTKSYLDTGKGKIIGQLPREVPGRRKDGSEITLELAVGEMKGDVQDRKFVANIHDITERKAVNNRLREREAQLRTITDALPVMIAYADMDRTYRFVNKTGEEWLARPRDEIIGQHVDEFHLEDAAELLRSKFEAVVQGDEASFEATITYPDGVSRDVQATYVPHYDDAQVIVGVHGLVADISERKAIEAQLQQAQKMESIGQLTGGIAHDFNNLLTIILGNLQLVERRLGDDERLGRRIAAAREGAERGASLTRQLLAFSRKQTLEAAVIDANELVANLQPMLRRTLGENVEVVTRLVEGIWPIEVDPHQLENALLNLSINARDAMPNGGQLLIETDNTSLDAAYCASHPYVEPGRYVMIAVSDTGTGMSEEVRQKVFEPFFTTKETGKGTGLGLSMVYGFAKQSHGHVNIYSEQGHGTSIKLYFPKVEAATITTAADAAISDAELTGSETLLVVEDDASVGDVAATLFEELGYRVLRAANGPDALSLLDQHDDVALLFTDVIMPGGMNGAELASQATARRPDLKVFFTSGYTANALAHNGYLKDGVDIVSKPYDLRQLAQRIRNALDR